MTNSKKPKWWEVVPKEVTFVDENGDPMPEYGVLKFDDEKRKQLWEIMKSKNITLEELVHQAMERGIEMDEKEKADVLE